MRARNRGSLQFQERAALPILDLHKPQIGLEGDFPGETRLGVGGGHPFILVEAAEAAHPVLGNLALRGGAEQGGTPVEPVDLDEDRARFR